jgi:ribosome-associated protein
MVDKAVRPPRVRKATRPTRASKLRRLAAKKMRSALKAQRAGTDL